MKEYGLIVIGAGMAGLSTALAWAKTHDLTREPVLVLEKEPQPGGCVTTFARKGYRFDTVQIIPDIADLLEFYGLEVDLISYEPILARLFLADPSGGAKIIEIPSSREAFEALLRQRYPRDARAIGRFFRYGDGLLEELKYLKTEPGPLQGLAILLRCPRIIAQSGRTYRQYLNRFRFKSRELLEVLDLFSSFSGLSGDRCAAILTACAMMTTLKGNYRPRSGFVTFPHSLRKALIDRGGEIATSSPVDRLIIEEGRIRGVLSKGTLYRAEKVVCTADARRTVEEMAGEKHFSGTGWQRRYRKTRPAPSSLTVHLGLDDRIDLKARGFDCGYNVLTTGRRSHEKAFDLWERGERLEGGEEFHLAVISPSAAIGGRPTLIIHVTPAAPQDWESLREGDYAAYLEKKEKAAAHYIRLVERYMIPNLREHILLTDVATPATYARYLGTRGGANSDMLSVPSNFGMFRLPARTPVKGLFIPKFSQGIWPSLMAGLQVVDMMTGGAVMGGSCRL